VLRFGGRCAQNMPILLLLLWQYYSENAQYLYNSLENWDNTLVDKPSPPPSTTTPPMYFISVLLRTELRRKRMIRECIRRTALDFQNFWADGKCLFYMVYLPFLIVKTRTRWLRSSRNKIFSSSGHVTHNNIIWYIILVCLVFF